MVRHHVNLTQKFMQWLRADERFEILAPAPLNLVCFRLKASDEQNERLMHNLNRSGKLYLSHTKLQGKFTLRFCVGQTYSEQIHVRQAWDEIQKQAATL